MKCCFHSLLLQVVRGFYPALDCYVSSSYRRLIFYDSGLPSTEKVILLGDSVRK